MSRVGKLPIAVPGSVKVAVDGGSVRVEGPKGKISKSFDPEVVTIAVEDNSITVNPATDSRHANAMHGTARSIIAGMVEGVEKGFEKKLEINGVGFRAQVKGKVLNLALGYSHDIDMPIPEGISITVDNNTNVTVSGYDKHMVGQVAATIYQYYPVEPYKGKGVRIVGQYVRRKEGKKAG